MFVIISNLASMVLWELSIVAYKLSFTCRNTKQLNRLIMKTVMFWLLYQYIHINIKEMVVNEQPFVDIAEPWIHVHVLKSSVRWWEMEISSTNIFQRLWNMFKLMDFLSYNLKDYSLETMVIHLYSTFLVSSRMQALICKAWIKNLCSASVK